MTVSLVVIAIISLQAGAYYEFLSLFSHVPNGSHDSGVHASARIRVDTIINYGNATISWSNQTGVPKGWNLYNLTVLLTNGRISASNFTFSGVSEHQILGINGVEQNSTYYWSLWKFCPSSNAWDWADVGADEIALSNNGVYGWYFQNFNTQYPPVTGAATVEVLNINSC